MKKVAMKMPANVARQTDPAEAWVQSRGTGSNVTPLVAPAEPMKRFTIDVSEGLHRRIKMQCAERGTKMADVIRELLEKEFPASKGQGA
ncbi:MAG TPA: plasmid partition protein ParG [Bosea sp. (in: a-proteobacteria)]|jgi:hypothetical protein|uniref:plasmid partition protein ParG n=1 Tax=Bosea sp. (in: a-proteobacteria) TaxID=1871050 RepID=UPI002DDD2AC8|nr:plasmid partition protein ParG [Bosea sp. (in: a-proteobacteria)]HEV2556982.1 plasmid partition protein ParG [Bosea sp. (in: a-proteobacteria)]